MDAPRVPRRPAHAVLLVALVLASGCLGAQAPPQAAPDLPVAATLAYAYACPPGPTIGLPNGLCVRTIEAWPDAFEEPTLAVHPHDPDVLAIGTNTALAATSLAEDPALAGRVDVFVSDDGGATWRRTTPPPRLNAGSQPAAREGAADPTLLFDDTGRLHVAQMTVRAGFERSFDVQVFHSDDLGRTWHGSTLLATDGDNDRPWLALGPGGAILLSWQNTWRDWAGSHVAWSLDGGKTWEGPLGTPGNCISISRALVVEGAATFACSLWDGDAAQGRRFLRLDLEEGAWAEVVDEPGLGNGWSFWDRLPDGRVALATARGSHNRVAVSASGIEGWRTSEPLHALCACRGAERPLVVTWLAADPWGGIHILLGDGDPGFPTQPRVDNARYLAGALELWHIVLDPDTMSVVLEQQLTLPVGDAREQRVPPPLGATVGVDHVHGLVFSDAGGLVLWTRDRSLDMTRIVASPGS